MILTNLWAQPPGNPGSSEVLNRFAAPEAKQGAAVDAQYFYAISNREIGKYRKNDGTLAARWKDEANGPFIHLNAGVVKDGKLYGAHSNYPSVPMRSSIEIWDVESMKHVGHHDFGQTDGSLTWLDHHKGNWYAAFVHYAGKGGVPGRGPEFSRVVKFDEQWQPLQQWTFPEPLTRRFAGNSSSCGGFGPGGALYVTGHDAKELYVLEFPREGSVLEWVATIPVAFEGQGFAWDPAEEDVAYGISRKHHEVIAVRLRASNPKPAAQTKDQVILPERGLCAHRGGCEETFPENTLPAFQEAVRLGVQMIEFDVRMTKDGAFVIMHDDTVNRTTNGQGAVTDLNFDEIRRLDAGLHKGPKFAGTRVPTLEETLDVMPRNIWLNCDLKDASERFGEEVAKILVQKGRIRQAIFACRGATPKGVRAIAPDAIICNMDRKKNLGDYVKATIAAHSQFIQLTDKYQFTREDLAPLRQNHVRINYFYAKTPSELAGLFQQGIDFVLVNDLSGFFPTAETLGLVPVKPEY